MNENILEIRHLSKTFGTHAVLKDVDFTVRKGDVTSIIGASGSGKSTLLRCINLLETLTTGEILFHGESVTGGKLNASTCSTTFRCWRTASSARERSAGFRRRRRGSGRCTT